MEMCHFSLFVWIYSTFFSSFQWQRGLRYMLHVQDHLLACVFTVKPSFLLHQTVSSQAQMFKPGFRSVTVFYICICAPVIL